MTCVEDNKVFTLTDFFPAIEMHTWCRSLTTDDKTCGDKTDDKTLILLVLKVFILGSTFQRRKLF